MNLKSVLLFGTLLVPLNLNENYFNYSLNCQKELDLVEEVYYHLENEFAKPLIKDDSFYFRAMNRNNIRTRIDLAYIASFGLKNLNNCRTSFGFEKPDSELQKKVLKQAIEFENYADFERNKLNEGLVNLLRNGKVE